MIFFFVFGDCAYVVVEQETRWGRAFARVCSNSPCGSLGRESCAGRFGSHAEEMIRELRYPGG